MAPPILIDPLDDLLGYQLRRTAFATMAPLLEAFAVLDLSSTEALVLRLVEANPGCNQSEIGRSLGVQRTNMAPIIGGLVSRGLIRRDRADGRTHALYLSREGLALHERVVAAAEAHEERFFGNVPVARKRALIEICLAARKQAARTE